MAKLSEEEKRELKELSLSFSLKEDMEKIAQSRYNPVNTNMQLDQFVGFLNGYNRFVNHQPRKFRKIEGSEWRE